MAERVQIDTTEWRSLLKGIEARGKNIAGILKAVMNTFGFKDIIDHFKDQEGPEGAWKPRSAVTQAWYQAIMDGRRSAPKGTPRAAYNPSNKLLQLTGAMRQSIGPTNVKNLTANSILVFSNKIYSQAHDEGAGKTPKRSFMWLTDETTRDMAEGAASLMVEGGNGV